MASMTTAAATFLGTSAIGTYSPKLTPVRRFVAAKASMGSSEKEGGNVNTSNGRRKVLVLAVAAAAASLSAGRMALAEDDEPKRGTPEAKKKYAPVRVTMPTARICHN